jgi:hypothetical protein
MMINLANIDVGGVLSGAGEFLKSIRAAITGKEPLDANKAAELALKAQELEATLEQTKLSIAVAEASSPDKWTSRARPSFMYCFYGLLISLVIIAPLVGVFFPLQMGQFYTNVAAGFNAIPEAMWWTFSAGYLGYVGARQVGKIKGSDK